MKDQGLDKRDRFRPHFHLIARLQQTVNGSRSKHKNSRHSATSLNNIIFFVVLLELSSTHRSQGNESEDKRRVTFPLFVVACPPSAQHTRSNIKSAEIRWTLGYKTSLSEFISQSRSAFFFFLSFGFVSSTFAFFTHPSTPLTFNPTPLPSTLPNNHTHPSIHIGTLLPLSPASPTQPFFPRQQQSLIQEKHQVMALQIYDFVSFFFTILLDIFFREIRPRGAHKIPQKGPVIFVAAPHANQV